MRDVLRAIPPPTLPPMRAAHPLLPTTPSPIPVHPQRGRGPALQVPRARAPACAGRVRASPSSDAPPRSMRSAHASFPPETSLRPLTSDPQSPSADARQHAPQLEHAQAPLRVFSRIVDIRSWAKTAMIPIVASLIGVDASTSRNGSVNERSRNPRLPRSRITSIAILFEPANRSNARTTRTTPSRRYSTRSRQARSQCSERARTCTGPANRSNQPRW